MRATMEGVESVGIKWLKQRALEKWLEAGIRRALRSARKEAGKTNVSPTGTLACGSGGVGKGPWSAAGSPRLRRSWSGAAGPRSAPCPSGSVHSSRAGQHCGRVGGKGPGGLLPPGKRRSVSPRGGGGGGGFAAATGSHFLWMRGGGSPADPLPARDWGPCQPFGSLWLLRVAPI